MTAAGAPNDDAIDRREALRRAALLLGGALSAPAIAGVLAGCGGDAHRASGGESWTPRALTAEQGELVATIAEHVIPETDTPGARAAGVHRFIDAMLAEYYPAAERERFVAGLAEVDARARRECGRVFLRCDAARQRALLDRLDAEAYAAAPPPPRPTPDPVQQTERGAAGTKAPADVRSDSSRQLSRNAAPQVTPHAAAPVSPRDVPFMRTMKELTLLGYYTSEVGATKELRWVPVPGRFEGCVPLAKVGGRAWAV
jgi:hypothetical protein